MPVVIDTLLHLVSWCELHPQTREVPRTIGLHTLRLFNPNTGRSCVAPNPAH